MRGNMKLGKKGNYVVNIILVACVYAVIFALCKLDVKDYAKSYQDIEELLCAVSGFRMTDLPMDIQGQMIKWMLSLSVVYILVGRDIYDPLNHLKYIAMVRYGSYRRFYQTLMNKTCGKYSFCTAFADRDNICVVSVWRNRAGKCSSIYKNEYDLYFTADTVMSRADSLHDLVFRIYSQCAGSDLLVCAGSVWFLPCGGSLAGGCRQTGECI